VKYMGAVKLLLGRKGVNPYKPDIAGTTPLSHAAESGNGDAVKLQLRQEEVNSDKPDHYSSLNFLHPLPPPFLTDRA